MSDPVKVLYGHQGFRADEREAATSEDHEPGVNGQDGRGRMGLEAQASDAMEQAKSTVAAIAVEARARFADIVDQQKAAGADQVAGMARAAHSAAGDLETTNPHLASMVKTAADSVDTMARSIRGSDVGDIVTSLAEFGRRRPMALFGGAVVAGLVLARFLKSTAPAA